MAVLMTTAPVTQEHLEQLWADERQAREQMERHRQGMHEAAVSRAQTLLRLRQHFTVAEIAHWLGVSGGAVYKAMSETGVGRTPNVPPQGR